MTALAPVQPSDPHTIRPTAPIPSPSSARWDEAPQYLLTALFRPTRLTTPVSRTLTSGALFGWAVGCSLLAFTASLPAVLPLLESDLRTALQATGGA
jgi:hypothetical protein